MIDSSDISVVLQGPVRQETLASVRSIRKYLPKAEIILSTWEGEDVDALRSLARIIESKCPEAYVQHDRLHVRNNLNRLIRSTQYGLALVRRPYALKMRSDMVLDSADFLKTFERFQAAGPLKVLTRKVLVPALFSRRGYHGHATPFHLSDWAAFGLMEDLHRLFLPLHEVPEPEFTRWFDHPGMKSPYGSTLFRLAPEQYITESLYANAFGHHLMADARDNGPDIIEESDRFVVSNFIVAEHADTGFVLPKYPESLDAQMTGAEFFELWATYAYEQAYRKYCDGNYVPQALDEEALFRNRPRIEARLRLNKHCRRLLTARTPLRFLGELVTIPVMFLRWISASAASLRSEK